MNFVNSGILTLVASPVSSLYNVRPSVSPEHDAVHYKDVLLRHYELIVSLWTFGPLKSSLDPGKLDLWLWHGPGGPLSR